MNFAQFNTLRGLVKMAENVQQRAAGRSDLSDSPLASTRSFTVRW